MCMEIIEGLQIHVIQQHSSPRQRGQPLLSGIIPFTHYNAHPLVHVEWLTFAHCAASSYKNIIVLNTRFRDEACELVCPGSLT